MLGILPDSDGRASSLPNVVTIESLQQAANEAENKIPQTPAEIAQTFINNL
jgi:hypothetical protein